PPRRAPPATSSRARPRRSERRHPRCGRREAELGAKPLAPGEQLARVHAMPLGHRVHGLARHQGLRDQPALVLVRPAPSRLPAKNLDPRHPLAPRTSLTTRCKTARPVAGTILPSLTSHSRRPSPDAYELV